MKFADRQEAAEGRPGAEDSAVGARATAREAGPDRQLSIRRRQGPWKDALLRRMLAAADVVAVIAASVAAGAATDDPAVTTLWAAALMPLWVVGAKLHGLYDHDNSRIRHLTLDEFPSIFRWVTVMVALTAILLALGPAPLSVVAAVAMWVVALVGALVLRALARFAWRRLVPPERGLVIGAGELADSLARKLALEPGHHLALVASLPLKPAEGGVGPTDASLPELSDTIRREDAERVVLAIPDLDEEVLSGVVSTCRALGVKLSVAPPLRAMLGTAVNLNHLAELPLIEFRTWETSRSTVFLKRSVDAAVAAAGLVLLAPLLVLIALVIRLDSRGPSLFRQQRAGLHREPFRIMKFRTMDRDAEARLGEVVAIDELPEPMYKLRRDPRVTRVGRFLRRTSLDELPQLVNVAARRDEPRGTASRAAPARGALRRRPGLPLRRPAGNDRTDASPRARRSHLSGVGGTRARVHRELLAPKGRRHHASDGRGRHPGPRRILSVDPATAAPSSRNAARPLPFRRMAVVHDWFQGFGGGERVAEAMRGEFRAEEGSADVFTFHAARELLPAELAAAIVGESRVAHLPGVRQRGHHPGRWRNLLPYMPTYFRHLDLSAYDLVVASSWACALHARPPEGAAYVCYCHTPMRYVWLPELEGPRVTRVRGAALRMSARRLRRLDREASRRPDGFVANSHAVRERIERFYDREAEVIPPPVDVDELEPTAGGEGRFLWVQRLIPYKRPELVAEAFRGLPFKLTMVGIGPLEARLRGEPPP